MAALVVRDNPALERLLRDNPSVRRGRTLSGQYVVLEVPDAGVNALLPSLGNTKLDAYALVVGLLGQPALDAAGITPVQRRPLLDLRGRGVLLGFVDTGIDYTQAGFRYENHTSKIRYIWDQTLSGVPPEGFGFGAEYTAAQLGDALKAPDPFAVVPHRDTVGHGTFLASVAASRAEGEYAGAAPDAEILAVKLRPAGAFYREVFAIPAAQENAFESSDVMLGVEYILTRASELGRPVAICISVGTHLGGHDGYSVFEEYLSRVSHQSGVVICCAAGNEGAAARHMSGVIAKADDIQKIEISVGPRSPDVYVSLWNAAPDRVSVAVTSPTGEMVGRVPARNGASVSERLVFERSTVQVYYFFPIEGSGSQLTVVKILAATAGLWTILAHGDIITDGRFDAWLPIAGFADPEVRFLSPSPDSTVVVPGSADGMLTCGSFNARTLGLAATSSWGPTRRPELAPDLTAPGEAVPGDFPTGHGELDGTSVAAAVASAACALMLQWGVVDGNEPMMNTYLARAYLIRGCDRSPALTYPNNQWGYGRLNLENTFNLLRRTPND